MSRGSPFYCLRCQADGLNPIVTDPLDQYTLEVAAKRRDGKKRLAQVSVEDMCRRHALEAIRQLAPKHAKPLDPMGTASLFDA